MARSMSGRAHITSFISLHYVPYLYACAGEIGLVLARCSPNRVAWANGQPKGDSWRVLNRYKTSPKE